MVDSAKQQKHFSSRSGPSDDLTYTLITGSSQGIGRALAEECAARGMNLLLVALDNPFLSQTVQELREQYKVEVKALGIDLTNKGAARQIYDWTLENGYLVDVLINNAGFGRSGLFEKIDLQEYLAMMQLNNQVLVELTYHFLPSLQQLPRAHILNMSSMEATLPLPYKSVYTGTKNFVYTFSLALREELKESAVRVSVICPGPVLTNEDGLKRIKSQGKRSRLLLMMPEEVAPIAISGMLQGRNVIIPGRFPYFLVKLARLFPTSTKMSILERIFRAYKYQSE